MGQDADDIARACLALIERTETLSKQVLALINLNAFVLREVSLSNPDPHEYFTLMEAQIGGLAEAIAIGTRQYQDIPVSSVAITEVYEQVLRQARNLLECSLAPTKSLPK